MTCGERNCNPGNIRQSGERFKGEIRPSKDRAFKQFEHMAWGYRAIFVVLSTYRRRHALKTVEQMIARWAPPSENHTQAYMAAVERIAGLHRSQVVDPHEQKTMTALAAAISEVENGHPARRDEVEEGWRLFVEG